MHSTVVVLPAPLAPISPTISPVWTSRSTPSTTVRFEYRLRSPRTVTTGVLFMGLMVHDAFPIGNEPRMELALHPWVEAASSPPGAHDPLATDRARAGEQVHADEADLRARVDIE